MQILKYLRSVESLVARGFAPNLGNFEMCFEIAGKSVTRGSELKCMSKWGNDDQPSSGGNLSVPDVDYLNDRKRGCSVKSAGSGEPLLRLTLKCRQSKCCHEPGVEGLIRRILLLQVLQHFDSSMKIDSPLHPPVVSDAECRLDD